MPADERVLVDIQADVTPEVLARIRALGGTVINSVPRYRSIRAELRLAALELLAELDEVQAIRPADIPVTHRQLPGPSSVLSTGALHGVQSSKADTSEGDVAHRANTARQTYSVDGTGIGIGVISDGVDTLADQQATGDVPAQVTVLPGQEGGPFLSSCRPPETGEGSEGTAILEIVHDLAPGAALFFATGGGGRAQMAQNIEDLCEAGASVIVDDIGYLAASAFQDGVIAEAISAATEAGCYYFSSAGNGGNLSDGTASVWEGDFAEGPELDLSVIDTGAVVHDFGGGVTGNRIEKDSDNPIILQWADPTGASANDYDLFLIDADDTVLASSTTTQDGTQDPLEYIISPCSGDRVGARLVIVKNAGAADRYLRLSYAREGLKITTAGQTFGHSASEDAIGVGAVDVGDAGGTGGVFNGTESVETFSSDGPRRIFFEADGAAITSGNFSSTGGRLLQKPDLAAADAVSTSTPGFSTFSGTSAAAPHAAAIAALMVEAAGGPTNVTLAALRTAMTGSALDIEAMGVDRDSGAGIVMAPAAVDAVDVAVADRNGAPTVVSTPADRTLAPDDDAVTIELAAAFSDPDTDALTYTALSSDNARLSLAGPTGTGTSFTLTPGSPGRVVVTVVATDPEGLSAVLTFVVTVAVGSRDYDSDDDGLIDVGNLAQLNAMRYDLNGDGWADAPANWSKYHMGFVEGSWNMGCPTGCIGYELTADLDFDTDGDGDVDSDDDYWNAGAGWAPVGDAFNSFTATFDGDGHTVSNLLIKLTNSSNAYPAALFGFVRDGVVRDVGLPDVDVTGGSYVGGLVGYSSDGEVSGSYVTGSVSAVDNVGGLVGRSGVFFYNDQSRSAITDSHSSAQVSGGDNVGGLVGLNTGTSEITGSHATGHIEGTDKVGGLVGFNTGPITTSYATGRVEGTDEVGGLVGDNRASITASYATGHVEGNVNVGGLAGYCRGPTTVSFATGHVEGTENVGGLVGYNLDIITATYATGHVEGGRKVGGLVGYNQDRITTSFATGLVWGNEPVGGLVGEEHLVARQTASYWDIHTSGHSVGRGGRTTKDLQAPTEFGGIYETWNVDLDGDAEADEPWDFGTSSQYPVLVADIDGNGDATWQEFGYQVRAGPTLTASTSMGQAVVLTWTAADTSPWSPAPDVAYAVIRERGTTVAVLEPKSTGLQYTDAAVTAGTTYEYQVGIVVDGGVAARSALLTVVAGVANQPPQIVLGTLPDRTLMVATTEVVDVSDAFSDLDDTLTYAATSSDEAVATVSVSGSLVTITPVGVGQTTITVTATEEGSMGRSVTQSLRVTAWTGTGVDYDADNDGLIEIMTMVQLDAVRHDLNGDGVPILSKAAVYAMAFPTAANEMGCPSGGGCTGYELEEDLDFDTNGNGRADAGDLYWRSGNGWEPIGKVGSPFRATFEGNGRTVRNLFSREFSASLFGGSFGTIRRVGLIDVDLSGGSWVAGLVGTLGGGEINSSYVTGRVSGTSRRIGGLVAETWADARISASYATATVTGSADAVGGLVGFNRGAISASYATGRVSGGDRVGGLIGVHCGSVVASYATGTVSSGSRVGGLIGGTTDCIGTTTVVTSSYWDTSTSGQLTGAEARTTAQLQAPTGYTGLYAAWNVDPDGDGTANDPWDFGTGSRYPALTTNFDGVASATWDEFGYQLRAGPTLTVSTDTGLPVLTWTAVDASDWNPAPTVGYTVIRDDGSDPEAIASGLNTLTYTDRTASEGDTYKYQVAATVDGGEAVRSSIVDVTVTIPDTTPPVVRIIESDATHPTKDPFNITITFTKSVAGLTASEIEVANGTGSNFSGSGSTYRLRVTPDADYEGSVTVTVPAGVAMDSSMNLNDAGSKSFAVDTRVPAPAATDAATVDGATLTLTFDEALASANTSTSAFTVTGGTTRSVSGVLVSGAMAQLTIDPPVLSGETGVELDYRAPSRDALADAAGNKVASFQDRAVTNETPASTISTEVGLSLDTVSVAEGAGAKTVVVTGTLNRSARPTATDVTVGVGAAGDTATEGADYTTVDDLTLTIPAYRTSATARFTLTPANDRIDEQDESLTVTGSTTISGLTVTPSGGLSIDITDNDGAPSLVLSVDTSSFAEDSGTATVTVGTGSGSTFESAQTVTLSVAGTATETTDYTISDKTLTLPAGMGTSASTVSATLTGVDDDLDDDGETVVVSATHNGVPFGDRRTVTIEDDDDPEVTVSFSQAEYRAVEGGHVDVAVTLSAVPERQVSIPVEAEGADGAGSADFSISPSTLSFGANERTKTVRVSAANDSAVDPGESVALSFGTPLPDRVSEGSTAQATVTIRDEDFTFVPAFAARSGTTEPETGVFAADEDDGALRLTLELATPRGVRVEDIPDPVVVTLATRENAGTREADEDYATQRRSGTFGDYGGYSRDLSFAPADFSDDGTCGCATAEKSVSVDLFNDRVYERTEVFGLRLSRKTGRLSVSSQDVTIKIEEDDAEPVLTLGVDPATVAEAGGTSAVTVSTGTGSTFPTAQTIDLDLSGTATEDADFEIDTKRLTLPAGAGTDTSSVATTVRGLDDAIDDDAETIVLSAVRDGAAFANRTLTITDDDTGSTRVDLAVNPARVREDAASVTVRVTASLNAGARAEDTEVSVTVGSGGDSADEGTDYETVGTMTLIIDAGDTEAETTFTLRPTNDDSAEGAERITVDGNVSGLAVRAATLTLNDDDVESTEVALTLDPDEVGEAAGSRAVRITGALNGGPLTTNTLVAVTVGSAVDSAVEGTDYTEVGALELSIPANRTDGSVTFTLRPTNDATAEGEETIAVSGDTAGLTVVPAELVLADNDAVSTRLALSLRPSSVSEGAAPTDVTVTGTLDAGARETETLVTLTVGARADSAVSDTDYVAVSNRTLTIPANETRAETTFTLTPEDDAIAEGAESITVDGSTSGLTVEAAALTLSDNDTASRVVMLAVDPPLVREDTPEQVTVTAGLDAAARVEDTTVRLTVGAADDTAVPGRDYRRVDDRELTISAGETAATATFFMEPLNNQSADGARALRVTGTTSAVDLRVEPAAGARIELEDDDIPAVLVMPAELTVTEAGSADYRVALQTAPTADVTVAISGVSGDLSLNKPSLAFAPGDFDVAQTVSVMAADDADNTQDPDVTVTHRASGAAEYRGLRSDLVVTIRENDPSLVFSATSVSVPEGGMAEYTVALAIEPSANVMVSISGVSGDLSLNRMDLEFTRGTWNIAQPVTVEAAEDDDTSTDPRVTLTHRASGGGYDGIVGSVQVSVTENDGGGTGGGSGGAANHPPVVEREIEDQTLDVGEVLELDIRLNFYDRDQRALDYTAESADPSVATAAVDRNGLVTIRGIKRGVTAVTVTAADRRDERASDSFAVTVRGPAFVALFPRAADPALEGFARVINHAAQAGEVSIEAIDDSGARFGPIALAIEAGETVHFNSGDLEDGNAAKGLPEGVGSGEGDWRLVLSSELDFEALSYIRTGDGFLTAMHDTVPIRDGAYDVAIFNPGSNANQVSRLRLINPGDAAAEVTVTGVDDAGASPGTSVELEIPAGESLTLTASDLETGPVVAGALGDGAGKWRLRVMSTEPIVAMSLLSSPTGHLTNLSTVPATPGDEGGTHVVPLFPSASDPLGRQGFVRVVNRSTEAGMVHIAATDDSALAYGDVTLSIGAGATVHFNSNDLELGNAAKGLSGSTGAGIGDWRLDLSSELDIQVLAYIRTSDGFLTSMHDVAPSVDGRHWVAILNPGSNPNQVSLLRLVNPGTENADVTITGIDDASALPVAVIEVEVLAGQSVTVSASDLESGTGVDGALGDGIGKWRLRVASEVPIVVMSLLSSPTGHLTNLSTAPSRGVDKIVQ